MQIAKQYAIILYFKNSSNSITFIFDHLFNWWFFPGWTFIIYNSKKIRLFDVLYLSESWTERWSILLIKIPLPGIFLNSLFSFFFSISILTMQRYLFSIIFFIRIEQKFQTIRWSFLNHENFILPFRIPKTGQSDIID